jgi:TolB-like protein/Flp pilus assembly protein TadD
MSILEELKRRNVIRVAVAYAAISWLLIQVVETIFPLFELPDSSARMVVIVLGLGLIPALVLSWVFELTAEGLKKESEIDRSQPTDPATDKTFDRVVMLVLALALSYFTIDKFILSKSRVESARQEGRSQALAESYGEKSIAVLPFVDMSAAGDQEYMSDGIAEELLNLLAKIPQLRVISRSSAFSFKDKDIDIPTIAEQLNVAHILEGSVRKAGERIRITAQLIEARSDTHLWSKTYDRVLDDIFAIQDEIAEEVVVELKFTLLGETPTVHKTDPEAYDEYLLAQHLMHQRTKASIEQAARHFERAVELDPDYAPAHAGSAIAWMLLQDSNKTYGDMTLEESVARASPSAERALELDPGLAEAHAAMGFIHYQQQFYEEAQSQWDRALELNPNYAMVHMWRGILMSALGRYQDKLESTRAAAELDPLSTVALNNYMITLFARGQYDEVNRIMQRIKAIAPQFYNYARSWMAWQRGMPAEAVYALLDGLDIDPEDRRIPGGLTNMFGLLGLHDEAVRQTRESDRYLPYQWISDWAAVREIAQENYSANPDSRRAIAALGQAFLVNGDIDAAAPLLERYLRGFEDGVGPDTLIAGYVALLRQINGDSAGVAIILEPLKARHQRALAGGLNNNSIRKLESVISLLEGRQSDAIVALEALSRGSSIEPHVVASLRQLTPLNDDARFDEILAKQAAHSVQERQRLLTRICGNDGWERWQPLPQTCVGQHTVD